MDKRKPRIITAEDDFSEAVSLFNSAGTIAFPTETFYGLCVNPFDRKAVSNLFDLKGRPRENPIPLIIGELSMLERVAAEVPSQAKRLIKRFWPGPLTIVFKARPELPEILTAGTGTIGVRLSGDPCARRLSNSLASPVTSTSANPSGKKPPVAPKEVIDYFDGKIDMLIDGGALKGKRSSTIVDVTGHSFRIIREGEIEGSEILKYLGES